MQRFHLREKVDFMSACITPPGNDTIGTDHLACASKVFFVPSKHYFLRFLRHRTQNSFETAYGIMVFVVEK